MKNRVYKLNSHVHRYMTSGDKDVQAFNTKKESYKSSWFLSTILKDHILRIILSWTNNYKNRKKAMNKRKCIC